MESFSSSSSSVPKPGYRVVGISGGNFASLALIAERWRSDIGVSGQLVGIIMVMPNNSKDVVQQIEVNLPPKS